MDFIWLFWPDLPSWLRYTLSALVIALAAYLYIFQGGSIWTWPVALIGAVMLLASIVQA